MKKPLAILLMTSMVLSLAACSDRTGNAFGGGNNDDPSHSTTEESHAVFDTRELPPVDVTESFGNFHASNFDIAWGATQELRMATGNVENYFCQYSFDYNNNLVNQNLNYKAVVSRPAITLFDSQDEDYAVYEVIYTQLFPICSREPSNVYRSFFSYHNVGYVDFYTGTTFPCVNLSTQIDSFCVTGTVEYNGKTYNVSYYEYREDEWSETTTQTDGDYTIQSCNVKITTTAYFVVPKGYDGILMYVFVADDTDRPVEEVLAEDNPYFEAPGFFGDDEDPNDYVFFGIHQPK